MSRSVRVSALDDAISAESVAVVVTMRDGEVQVPGGVPSRVGEVELPATLSPQWCAARGLTSTTGSTVTLGGVGGPRVLLVVAGSCSDEDLRLVGAAVVRAAGSGPVALWYSTQLTTTPARSARALVEGALLASYDYKAAEKERLLTLVPLGDAPLDATTLADISSEVSRGEVVATSVNWAKRLSDTPAGSMTPKVLAQTLYERLNEDPHVTVAVWTQSKIRRQRLGGLLGVGSGSAQPTRLVYATYDPAPGAPLAHVALVGKGVTFDSGGLSLKPADSMMTMKTDMSGAAIVAGALSAVSRLGLRVRVTMITPLTENLVGDEATKPGDVLTIRNGLTVEVLNTDAEGRLILADGLSLAAETDAEVLIDVATLTGAQRVALGEDVGALFSSDDELATQLLRAGERSGETLWRLPLVESYESHLDSDVADMKNIGRPPRAGSIVAALFLRKFTAGRPWAHLDIAGPARADAARGYTTKGATAFSLRALVEYLSALTAPGA